MTLEAQRCRQLAVPLCQLAVANLLAAGPRHQCPQAQQPDLAVQGRFTGAYRQPSDHAVGFGDIALFAAGQQRVHQHTGGRAQIAPLAGVEQGVHGVSHQREGTVAVSGRGHLACYPCFDDRKLARVKPLGKDHFAHLREHCGPPLAFCRRVPVQQSETHAQPGQAQRDVVAGSLGDPQRRVDVGQGLVVGRQHSRRDRGVCHADHEAVHHRIGSGRHDDRRFEVVPPPWVSLSPTGRAAHRERCCRHGFE